MLVSISVVVILAGVLTELAVKRRAQRNPDFGDAPEGVQFIGYTLIAFGAVALYGALSGQIVLPMQ